MRSLSVFCGSSAGNRPEYFDAARSLGTALAQRRIKLVYGGASVGLMGAVADAALEAGGKVVGVLPRHLAAKEIGHPRLTRLELVETMHERKARMAELSDGFVALPGGIGTLEELFEVWTWAQLGLHRRPCALLNAGGYYDALIGFLDQTVSEGFVKPTHRSMLVVDSEASSLLDALERYEAPSVHKWLDKSELAPKREA
jgi:uncharacterized protein (TIGR00730 family)